MILPSREQISCSVGFESWFCNAQECNLQRHTYRNATTAAHVCDHKVEMESDEERKKLTRIRVQQHHNLICAYVVSLLLLLPPGIILFLTVFLHGLIPRPLPDFILQLGENFLHG